MDNSGNTVESKEFLGTPTSTAVGKNDAPGANPASGFSRTVTVPAGDSSNVVKVTFSNTLTTGVIEVCKKVTDVSLTGTWAFTVTGGNGFTATTSTTPGNCSPAITLPSGHFKVVETGNSPSNAESVTSITAVNQSAGNVVKWSSLPAATVVATVDVGDSSKQTIVTFTNNLVTFKLCKNYDGVSPVTSYPFTLSTVAGSAGPNTPPATVSVAPGTCKDLGSYRAGTRVLVTEGITPGTKVGAITANQGIVATTLNRPDRSVQVDLLAGETVLTYLDVPAPAWSPQDLQGDHTGLAGDPEWDGVRVHPDAGHRRRLTRDRECHGGCSGHDPVLAADHVQVRPDVDGHRSGTAEHHGHGDHREPDQGRRRRQRHPDQHEPGRAHGRQPDDPLGERDDR